MKQCGTARRIVREPDHTFYIWILVYYCETTGKYHRVLPDFLIGFVHHSVYTVLAAIEKNEDLDLYDYPSDITRMRWIGRFSNNQDSRQLSQIIKSASKTNSLLWPVMIHKRL